MFGGTESSFFSVTSFELNSVVLLLWLTVDVLLLSKIDFGGTKGGIT